MDEVRFSVDPPRRRFNPTEHGNRYFVDLRNGAFIYVFPKGTEPPYGWPMVEMDPEAVEELLFSELE